MSQKQNKRDKYLFEILEYCYFRLRKELKENNHYSYILYKENLLSNFPAEDKIIASAALKKLINLGFLEEKSSFFIEITSYGVISFEETYKPSGVIHFSSLIFPFLRVCYNLLENKERISRIDEFIEKLKEEENIILKENEHWEILHILSDFGFIRILEGLGGTMHYQSITSEGINYLFDITPPNEIEHIVNTYTEKFLILDYFPKDLSEIRIRLFKWIEQFSDKEDKLTAAFLISNLLVIKNQWCIDSFNSFYEQELSSLDIEDIFVFPAGTSGSSAEYWRHKFVRELYGGKEISRTLNTFESESQHDFWDDKIILFVDDLVGSGDQFTEFVETYLLETSTLQNRFQNSRVIYFTPIATEFGINEIKKNLAIEIELYHETVIKKLFDDDNPIWDKSTFIPKLKIEEVCKKYGNSLNLPQESVLGYNDSQLLICFQDHTPDNTLPIFWFSSDSNPWRPLLKR